MAYLEAHKNMFVSSRHELPSGVNINIPWDSNAFKGLIGGITITLLVLLFIGIFDLDPVQSRIIERNRIPIEILSFGSGDGTGMKSGNLTEEGVKIRGREATSNLQDAEVSAKNGKENISTSDEVSDRLVAVKDASTNQRNNQKNDQAVSAHSVGAEDGSDLGSGLKTRGSGKGSGDGFGDIDWGGGGNRVVLKKVLPKMPAGVHASARIVLRFKVLPNGLVSTVTPTTKADPALERAAIEALRKWQFNPLDTDAIMEGVIPLTFILR